MVAQPDTYSSAVALRDLHGTWAWVVVLANGVVGTWTLAAHWIAALRVLSLIHI